MFEKEAEEYKPPYAYCSLNTNCELWKDGFQKGAEQREKRIAEQEELLSSTLEENKDIYKKMADLDTALEDCTESLTDARIKIKELKEENAELRKRNGKLAGQNASLNRWLGEAIPFIKDYMIITIGDHTTVCSVPEENRCINVLKLNERAKSFLKEFE